MNRIEKAAVLGSLALLALACDKKEGGGTEPAASASAMPKEAQGPAKLDKVTRGDFNRVAAELALPVFWREDANKNGALDPSELAVYWGLEPGAQLADYVAKGAFTPKALEAYDRVAKRASDASPAPGLEPKEAARRAAVVNELAQGKVTLVSTDLSGASPEEKAFVSHVAKAADIVTRLYETQEGTLELASKIPADDPASKSLFYRAQGPKCDAPQTKDDPACSAVPDAPKGKLSGMYPAELLADPKMCDTLKAKGKDFVDPFHVVGGDAKAPKTVPYTEALKADMAAVSAELTAAADALGEKEPSLKSYLVADAKAFLDNNWWPADEAWAKMDSKNSKYYLRVAPDENYAEPCSTRALFQVSFGIVNPSSTKWTAKLDPLKKDMEATLGAIAGAPYKVRPDIAFKLPDFVDIALNAGDARPEFGATIGESLPNYGPVSEGRGRTIAMTNFYTDPDSIEAGKGTTSTLLCKDAMAGYTTDPEPLLMSTILHEAAHNLGPANQYKVNGKVDREAFGGPLAATLEELKAQTAALFFTDWLVEKQQITADEAKKAHVRDVVWGFGHISRGMYDSEHHPHNYSQLAAIQLGWFMKDGAVAWKPDEIAANGKDKGCFSIDEAKLPASVKSLMTEVAQLKAKGDKGRADKLVKDFVDVDGDKKKVHEVITERVTRAPKQSFVYSIKLD